MAPTTGARGVLARAVLEGLAFKMRSSFELLVQYPEVTAPSGVVPIGGAKNDLLIRI